MNVSISAGSVAGLLGAGGSAVTALGFAIVPQGSQLGPAALNFADYEGMKNFQGGICVNTYLSKKEKDLLNKASVDDKDSSEWHKLTDKFTNPQGQPKGCVAIAWNQETWEDVNKWKGVIRYEWLYTIGDETLVSYGLYTTKDDSSGIKWRTIYVNGEKNTSAGVPWEGDRGVMSKKPKFSSVFAPDFDQICKESHECFSEHREKNTGEVKWTWAGDNGSGKDKFSDWSKNFGDAFSSLNSRLILKSPNSQFSQLVDKRGVWTER